MIPVDCVFCKIAKKEIPAEIVYEDEKILCFKDVAPQAPVHCLIITRTHYRDLLSIGEKELPLMAHLLGKVLKIAKKLGLEETGFRLVNNCKESSGQSVFHLHFHIMGGRAFQWPPG